MVNLDLYRVFYVVAKRGSLTKAAEELYISQPAVSQSVKQLENQLGVALFNRTHRGMELSEECGKRFEELVKVYTDKVPCPDCGGETIRDYSGEMYSSTGKQTKKCTGHCATCGGCH